MSHRALIGAGAGGDLAPPAVTLRDTDLIEDIARSPGGPGLLKHLRVRDVSAGDCLHEQGVSHHDVFVVRSGLVKLRHRDAHGTTRAVRLLGPHDTFGLESLLRQISRHEAVALTDVTVQMLPADHLLAWAHEAPARHALLMHRWYCSLEQAEFVITRLSTGSARARVARLLLHMGHLLNSSTPPLPSRVDMASLLGLTTETTSRIMAAFRREGVIVTHRGRLLGDTVRLQDVARDL